MKRHGLMLFLLCTVTTSTAAADDWNFSAWARRVYPSHYVSDMTTAGAQASIEFGSGRAYWMNSTGGGPVSPLPGDWIQGAMLCSAGAPSAGFWKVSAWTAPGINPLIILSCPTNAPLMQAVVVRVATQREDTTYEYEGFWSF